MNFIRERKAVAMNNQSGYRARGVLEFLAVIFLVAVVGIGFYCYQTMETMKKSASMTTAAQQQPVAVAPQQTVNPFSGEYEAVLRDKSRLEGENSALKAAKAQFESEKSMILNQVRTSVKAFDDYRNQMAEDMRRMNEDIAKLREENGVLRDKTSQNNAFDSVSKAHWENKLNNANEEIAILRETVSVLKEENAAKNDRAILMEAGKLHYNVGNFYFRNKEYQSAIDEYKKSLMYQPHDSDVHYNLAIVADEFLGDRQLALGHYKKFLALEPMSENANAVEERILDLELYETVLAGDKGLGESKIKFLEPAPRKDNSRFYR
ncbi:MAG: tetratricopeptide repeat protein [Candidatus Omnitrophica bacterium]|nr:tetratricopeptide repeat protein [Candidatus Omnitrophota bacterium]